MITYIKFVKTFLKTLRQIGLVDGRRIPTPKEIKAEWIAFQRNEHRVAPIGTTGRVFQSNDDPLQPKTKGEVKVSIKKIRVYRAATDSYETIEDNT